MATADSIIAATCIVFEKQLLTRNIADFAKIKELRITDPVKN
jgi:predicted nucleic acid-binding protein